MNENIKVKEIKKITPRQVVEKERQRLLNTPKRIGFKEWLGDRKYPLKWMKEQFGETLTEKDGFTHPNGERVSDGDCNICGKQTGKDEEVFKIIFNDNFCDEYDLDLIVCKDCSKLKEIKNE